ncbi:MAG: hypothetical protein GC136_09610 [Alphaproteobacteria bacterium]|nr:hypothetical protein [Alphaproteobacteria bacterium]
MMDDTTYIEKAIALSRKSYEEGNFPAGAVLVKDGVVLAEAVSSPYPNLLHADGKALSAAYAEHGPLDGVTLYVGMEPCIMCISMLYWAGVRRVVYALAKNNLSGDYYESHSDLQDIYTRFNEKIEFVLYPEYGPEVLQIVKEWEDKYMR